MAEMGWFQLSFVALLFWGLWGFLDWKSVFFFPGVGQMLVVAAFYVAAKPSLVFTPGIHYAIVAGIFAIGASIPFCGA